MSNTYFDFRQFRINQDRCAMKVGTDGVLLGAWFELNKGDNVLDIGTGTGLVSLMAAQRGAGHVTGVEIDHDAAGQALENVNNSPYASIITILESDANSLASDYTYDRIVCNPPYFRNSLRCPDENRNNARHNDTLSYEQLVQIAARLLSQDGQFTVILPTENTDEFTKISAKSGLFPTSVCDIVTVVGKTPKRRLLSFSRNSADPKFSTLVMCNPDGSKTAEFIGLISPFYIRF